MSVQAISVAGLERGIRTLLEWVTRVAYILAPPLLRIALAVPFFRSGLTKWDGFLTLSPAATFLFEDEFKLHVFGAAYDFPAPAVFAFLDSIAEIVLPILLVVGLATRFSALGLLVMTGVIQLVVPDGWANFHLPWAALAVAIIALGPGALSLDNLIARHLVSRAQLSGAAESNRADPKTYARDDLADGREEPGAGPDDKPTDREKRDTPIQYGG